MLQVFIIHNYLLLTSSLQRCITWDPGLFAGHVSQVRSYKYASVLCIMYTSKKKLTWIPKMMVWKRWNSLKYGYVWYQFIRFLGCQWPPCARSWCARKWDPSGDGGWKTQRLFNGRRVETPVISLTRRGTKIHKNKSTQHQSTFGF